MKRIRGEGNIRERPNGSWEARFYVNGQRRSCYAKTKKECLKKLREAQRRDEQGLPVADEKVTVGLFLDEWLNDVKPSLRASTFRSYSDIVRLHLKPEIGSVKLTKLTRRQVQKLINEKLASGLSPRRVEFIYAVLRRALGQAFKDEQIPRNVAALANPPRPKKKAQEFLTVEQAQKLIEAAKGSQLETLLLLAITTGLRRGEIIALRWQDIDLKAGVLKVKHNLQIVDKEPCLLTPKSEAGLRTIPLPKVTITALKKHQKQQREDKMKMRDKWQEGGFVFTSVIGTPLDGDNLYNAYRKLLEKAELPAVDFKALRHTACSFLCAQGVEPVTAMEIMGHSQISLTMEVYAHALSESKQRAAKKMDELFRGL